MPAKLPTWGTAVERRLAAILIADVVGYTRLSHLDEEGTRCLFLTHLEEVFEPKIAEHHGRLIKTMGDGLLVEFPSIVNALRCAIKIQQAEAKKNEGQTSDQKLQFRIGINLGDVIAEGEDVHGDGVNIADRLQRIADPGGIVISGSAHDYVTDKVKVGLESLGEQRVKNIDKPIRAYRVLLDGSRTKRLTAMWPPRRHRAVGGAVIFVAAFIALVGTWWFWTHSRQPAFALPSLQSCHLQIFRVTPRTNASRTASLRTLSLTSPAFASLPLSPKIRLKCTAICLLTCAQIGKDLNVGYVLLGSFQREGDEIRITAQLVDANTGANLWSEQYDRPTGEIFALQT